MDLISSVSALVGWLISFVVDFGGNAAGLFSSIIALILFPINLVIFVAAHFWLILGAVEFAILLRTLVSGSAGEMAVVFFTWHLMLVSNLFKVTMFMIEVAPRTIATILQGLDGVLKTVVTAMSSWEFWVVAAILAALYVLVSIFINGFNAFVDLFQMFLGSFNAFFAAFDAFF